MGSQRTNGGLTERISGPQGVETLEAEALYCANHPTVGTTLRCNRCGKPICARCAVLTPVGYRCKECVRGQQRIFETVVWYDYLVAAAVAGVISGLLGPLLTALGWFIFFLAPAVGAGVAEAVRWAVRRRRGRYLAYVTCAAMLLALSPSLLVWLLTGNFIRLLYAGIYLALAGGVTYSRIRGLQI